MELDPGARKYPAEMSRTLEVFDHLYWEQDIVGRFTGNTLAFSPPLIINEEQIDMIVTRLRRALEAVA